MASITIRHVAGYKANQIEELPLDCTDFVLTRISHKSQVHRGSD
jgi:hypothetical protein